MTLTRPRVDPWAARPDMSAALQVGDLVRLPGGRIWVVGYVSASRARIHPLTTKSRTITVPDPRFPSDKRKKTMKEVEETGDPSDISPFSCLEHVDLDELTDSEFHRLEMFVATGGRFPLLEK